MQQRDRGYTPAWSIVCLSQNWVVADIQLCKIVLHAPSPGCSKVFFWSFFPRFSYYRLESSPTIILWGKLWQLICRQKSSPDNHPLGKLWQRDRINITGLNEWCRQTKKDIGLKSHLLAQIAIILKFSTFFQQCFQDLIEKYAFPTAKNILDFFNFYCQIYFFISDNLK